MTRHYNTEQTIERPATQPDTNTPATISKHSLTDRRVKFADNEEIRAVGALGVLVLLLVWHVIHWQRLDGGVVEAVARMIGITTLEQIPVAPGDKHGVNSCCCCEQTRNAICKHGGSASLSVIAVSEQLLNVRHMSALRKRRTSAQLQAYNAYSHVNKHITFQ